MALTEKQLALRRSGVTATDVRVLVLGSDFGRTAHDVWLDKMGVGEPWRGRMLPGDELVDLFPGSGMVGRAPAEASRRSSANVAGRGGRRVVDASRLRGAVVHRSSERAGVVRSSS